MGNPTSYLGQTLTWEGKQLTSAGTTTYEYDENGLRLNKAVNNVSTNYYYNGSVLMSLVTGNDTLLFSYDASGQVAAVNHNGTYYYYLRNGQGDIVKLIDNSGAAVVEYTYDTWGKQLSCTGSLASTLGALNPFRYRGYVYDEETGFYYLQSRYYDPTTGRFVSADVMLSTGQGVLGHNCYAYCLGNPVSLVDTLGQRPAKGMNNPDDEDTEGINSTKPNHDLIVFLFGESSELPDGAMYFVEFTSTIGFYVRGTSILFDEEKYCVYTFAGLCASKSYLPLGYVQSEGYVYNMNNIEDYEGFFSSVSASLGPFCAGGAKAFNGVYTEILGGAEMVGAGSAGLSGLWYWTTQNDWIYGRYPWEVADHPYNKIFRKDWERVGYA